MIIKPYSYNATSLQSTDYITQIPRSSALAQIAANLTYVRRAGAEPVFAGKDFQPYNLPMEVLLQHDTMTLMESVNQLFDVRDETPRQLIIQDTEDTSTDANGKQYYVYATPKQVTGGSDGNMATIQLGLDDSVWTSVKQYSQTWGFSTTNDSTSVTNNGNIKSYPAFDISVSAYPAGTGYIYNNYVTYIPPTTDAWNNMPLEICGDSDNVGLDTAALVAGNKALSSGNDFLVYIDGISVNRWFGGAGFNTTDTKVWVNVNMPPRRTFTLKTAISNVGTPSTIDLTFTTVAKADLQAMPNQGRLLIDSEEFSYTSRNITTKTISVGGITRATRNTSAASHSAAAVVYWIPFDINLVYGSSDVTTNPTTDTTTKPIFNLATSNNGSFVYADYADDALLRSGRWTPARSSVSNLTLSVSNYYTDVQGESTDPNAIAGMYIAPYYSAGVLKPETSTILWSNYFPYGVSTVSHSYERFQYTSTGPAIAGLQSSADGKTWKTAINYPSSDVPSTDYNTWTSGSAATTDISITAGTKYLRYIFSGTVPATANNACYLGMTTSTVASTNVSYASRRGEQSTYTFIGTITNSTNGQSFTINYPIHTGKTLSIDCNPNFPYVKYNGLYVNKAITLDSVRGEYLSLDPGANTLTFTADTVGTVSIIVYHYDRMNFQ